MKLKYNFVTNEVADKIVAVAVGDDLAEFNGFIKMNDVGASIFNKLKEDTDIDGVIAAMKKEYPDTPDAEVRETVEEFIKKLEGAGVIE